MVRKIVEQMIPWRGNVSDLATDVAGLLTAEEGAAFSLRIQAFLSDAQLRKKFLGLGHETEAELIYLATNPRDLWIVGVVHDGVMGLSSWDAPVDWNTEYALLFGVPDGEPTPLYSAGLGKMGAVARRLPESQRQNFEASLAIARASNARLVLCYWKPKRE